jgi:hypothetical protein
MLSRWEFYAPLKAVGAPVLFGHPSPNPKPFRVVSDVLATFVYHRAGLADRFRPVHLGRVATVHKKQMRSAFARCPIGPETKRIGGVFAVRHS